MANRKRNSEGRFASKGVTGPARDHPFATAAAAAGVAAAGAFLWTRRGQIGEAFSSGMDRLSELKSERIASGRTQSDFGEESLTLKETGRKTKGPRGPIAQQEIRSAVATSNQEAKAGAKAFS